MQRLANAMLCDLIKEGCYTEEDIPCGQLVVSVESPSRGACVMQSAGRALVTLLATSSLTQCAAQRALQIWGNLGISVLPDLLGVNSPESRPVCGQEAISGRGAPPAHLDLPAHTSLHC